MARRVACPCRPEAEPLTTGAGPPWRRTRRWTPPMSRGSRRRVAWSQPRRCCQRRSLARRSVRIRPRKRPSPAVARTRVARDRGGDRKRHIDQAPRRGSVTFLATRFATAGLAVAAMGSLTLGRGMARHKEDGRSHGRGCRDRRAAAHCRLPGDRRHGGDSRRSSVGPPWQVTRSSTRHFAVRCCGRRQQRPCAVGLPGRRSQTRWCQGLSRVRSAGCRGPRCPRSALVRRRSPRGRCRR